MNKKLINVQRGWKATCVVIKDSEAEELRNALFMDSGLSDATLFGVKLGNPIFKEKIEIISKKDEIGYFVLTKFDTLSIEDQHRYLSLIKDREFMGYTLPDNIIIVLTVEDEERLKAISPEVYHFCVVAF